MALCHWTPIATHPAQIDQLRSSRDGPQVLKRFQPFGDPVPTGELTLTSFLKTRWEFRASGFVQIRLRRLDPPTDPVLSLLRLCCDFAPVAPPINTSQLLGSHPH
jgi:hypothetical protein